MKKARIFLASVTIIGIVGGAVAAKSTGVIFWTTLVYGGIARNSLPCMITSTLTISATFYYFTTIQSAPAYYYTILKGAL